MLQVSNENHIEDISYIPVYDVFLGYLSKYDDVFQKVCWNRFDIYIWLKYKFSLIFIWKSAMSVMFDEKSVKRKLWFSISEEELNLDNCKAINISSKLFFWGLFVISCSFNLDLWWPSIGFPFCLELEFMLRDKQISLLCPFSICFAGELYFPAILI